MRYRRGLSLIELLLGLMITLMVLLTVGAIARASSRVTDDVQTDRQAKDLAYLAERAMGPDFRAAMSVGPSSTSKSVALVLPATDSTGEVIVPLQTGDVVSYYLSDGSGDPGAKGTILWRSVNGNPDFLWSLRGKRGRIDLRTKSLAFQYSPVGDPTSVRVNITGTRQNASREAHTASASVDLYLRNHLDP